MATRAALSTITRSGVTAAASKASVFRHQAFLRPAFTAASLHTSPFRRSASEKTHEPASQDLSHMAKNAKAEAKGALGSVLDAVGGQGGKRGGLPSGDEGASGVGIASGEHAGTAEVAANLKSVQGLLEVVPKGAIAFGAAGIVPYIATSGTTIWLARQAHLADIGSGGSTDMETALALLYHNESIQVAYGAVLLSFLGAIHWGFEFAKFGGVKGATRYGLGILPAILAWPTVLLPGQIALAVQWAAFTAVWYADMLATGKGWTPRWYSTYRFALTAVVGSLILLTLCATNYWGPEGQGFVSTGKKLQQVRDRETRANERGEPAAGIKVQGKLGTGNEMKTSSGDEAYVQFSNVRQEEEKRGKEEEKKNKAKQG